MSNAQEWMDSLEKFIVEEDRIVTYKWLSIKLKIHVNTSKRLLYSFTNSHDKDKLGICYLLAGEMPDGSCQVVVCRKNDVPKMKESFKIVTSQHVYSIQKNNTDADLNVILNSPVKRIEECIEDFKRLTSIECLESVVRHGSDIQQSKMKALLANKDAPPVASTSEVKKKINSEKENISDNKSPVKESGNSNKKNGGLAAMFAAQKEVKTEVKNLPDNKSSIKESVNNNKKNGGLAAMFAAQKEVKTEVKKPVPQQKNKQKGGLSMFLNSEKKTDTNGNVKDDFAKRQDSSPKKEKNLESVPPQKNEEKSNQRIKESGIDISLPLDDEKSSQNRKDSNVDCSAKESKNKSKAIQNKRKRKNKTDEKQKKKRKRIVAASDSEESNDEGQEEEYERMDESPLREPTPPPPISDDETPIVGKKGKKKKLVESTFMDEDGFLVTKKEYTLVSDSEEETEEGKEDISKDKSPKPKKEDTKKSELKNSPKKETKPSSNSSKNKISPKSINNSSPQKNKQASITSFFTKK